MFQSGSKCFISLIIFCIFSYTDREPVTVSSYLSLFLSPRTQLNILYLFIYFFSKQFLMKNKGDDVYSFACLERKICKKRLLASLCQFPLIQESYLYFSSSYHLSLSHLETLIISLFLLSVVYHTSLFSFCWCFNVLSPL